jgi:hypothetical protein
MLDHVERRRFLVKPAREHSLPALVRLVDVDLDEGAGQLLRLPRRGGLARAQAHDHVLPAHRLARPQRDILDDSVALVEDSENRHPLRHRGDAALAVGRHGHIRSAGGRGLVLLLRAAAARSERKSDQQRCGDPRHVYSGIHGS